MVFPCVCFVVREYLIALAVIIMYMKFSSLDKSILLIFSVLFVGLFSVNALSQYRSRAVCGQFAMPACETPVLEETSAPVAIVDETQVPSLETSMPAGDATQPGLPAGDLPQAPPGSDISLMPTPSEPTATATEAVPPGSDAAAPPGAPTPGNGLELISPPASEATATNTPSSPPGYQAPNLATATQPVSSGPDEVDSPVTVGVTPFSQQLSPAVSLKTGSNDYGKNDAFIAAAAMAVQFYYKRGELNPDAITDYRLLVREARGNLGPDVAFENPDFLLDTSNNSLAGYKWYASTGEMAATIKSELQKPNPVVVLLTNWTKLALGMPGVNAHAVLVYGIGSQYVYYIDPWDGKRYRMTIASFTTAVEADGTVHLVTFEVLK